MSFLICFLQAATIKPMAAEVSSQLRSWWSATAQLPPLPALVAAGITPQQQQQHTRQAVLLHVLIAGYFVLNHKDLEEWEDEPEPWAHANADAAASVEGLRSCCHQLALNLLLADKAALAPVLVQLLQQVSQVVPAGWGVGVPQTPQQGWQQLPGPNVHGPGGTHFPAVLLLKEAVYEAVGLAAYDLHDFVDYQGWLRSSLLPEMMAVQQQQQRRLLPVMPRAAARLVGHWVADLKSEDRPAVYAALTVLLVQPAVRQQQQASGSSSADVVLQLAAVSALRTLVDDFGFEAVGFVGVLPAVLGALCGMLQASAELDTQTQVRLSGAAGHSHCICKRATAAAAAAAAAARPVRSWTHRRR
jgi:hypothetical protein